MPILTRFFAVCGLFIGLPVLLSGQVNNSQFFNPHFATSGAQNQPSLLGSGFDNVQVNFLNTYGWFGNNNMDYGHVQDIIDADQITSELVDETLNKLDQYNNHLTTGAEFTPVSVAFKLGTGDHPTALVAGAKVSTISNLQYSRVLLNVAWNGNKQFKGEEVNLGPFKWNLLPSKEYYVGGAKTFPLDNEISIRPGIRLRYIQSSGSIFTERGNLLMYTQEDARRIRFTSDYKVHTALQNRDDPTDFNPMTNLGSGYGLDLGFTTEISEQLSASLSVADLGRIKFNENTKSFSKNETFDFEGVRFRITNVEDDDVFNFNTDSVEALLDPNISEDAYTMPLGSRLIFQGQYKFHKIARDDEELYKHQVYFLYVQGFENHLKASTSPYASLGYTYDAAKLINLGGSAAMGGYNKFTLGPYFSLNFGAYRLGLASNNLLPLIFPTAGTGFDASLNMALSF